MIEIGVGEGVPETYQPPVAAHRRAKPPDGVEENKGKSRSRAVAVAIMKGLDDISETAEIIDAIYGTLPEEIREQYEQDGRGLIDQAGQYGIDGADWKLQALYENWDRIDPNEAWKAIAKNIVEDQIHGLKNRHLPPGFNSADKNGSKAFGKAVNDLIDKVFG